jgi:hypothetical protein
MASSDGAGAMDLWELQAREAIRDTIATYNYAGDALLIADLAGCFAEDGVLELRGRPLAIGRLAITQLIESLVPKNEAGESGKRYVHHHVSSTHFISIVQDEARTRSYFQVMTAAGVDHWGRYDDTFAPSDGRWLLQRRKATIDGHSPTSRFGSH